MNYEGEMKPVWTKCLILPQSTVDILESKQKTRKVGANSDWHSVANEDIDVERDEDSEKDAKPDMDGDDTERRDDVMN